MKRTIIIAIFFLTEFLCTAHSRGASLLPLFPGNFKEKAFIHVDSLSSFGFRYADSKEETRTINYLKGVLAESHISTSVDTFQFQHFELQNLSIKINHLDFTPINVCMNPFKATGFSGSGYIFHPDSSSDHYLNLNLNDRIVISTDKANLFLIAQNKTVMAIIILNENDFNSLKEMEYLEVSVQATGELKTLKSNNLIATINPNIETDEEIIISAHWDSYKGPGADDNATGVGVMLELAKYFNSIKDSLNCKIQFVAFGAEELGLVGSQAFIQKHYTELKNCMLVFNIDEIGGDGDPYIEMRGGVDNVPVEFDSSKIQPDKTLYSSTDYHGGWLNLGSEYSYRSNVPDRLKTMIAENCDRLNFKFIPANGIGSDHQRFYPVGIVATSIVIPSDNSTNHSPDDMPDGVNLNGLEQGGKIVASVVLRMMKDKSTGVKTDFAGEMGKSLLLQNYPNPFNQTTMIGFQLSKNSQSSLKIFDVLGREVATLASETMPAGTYTRHWDAVHMPSGVYFYRLQTDSFMETKKINLVR